MLVMVFLSVISVFAAYRMLWWIGVCFYLFGWIWMANMIGVIDVGWLPILAALAVLVSYEYLKQSSSGRGYRTV